MWFVSTLPTTPPPKKFTCSPNLSDLSHPTLSVPMHSTPTTANSPIERPLLDMETSQTSLAHSLLAHPQPNTKSKVSLMNQEKKVKASESPEKNFLTIPTSFLNFTKCQGLDWYTD